MKYPLKLTRCKFASTSRHELEYNSLTELSSISCRAVKIAVGTDDHAGTRICSLIKFVKAMQNGFSATAVKFENNFIVL